MDTNALVAKTAKGEEEILRRSHGLDRNLRYVLILVDGKSSVEQILRKGHGLPDIEGSLRTLAEQGFVHVDGEPTASAGASASEPAAVKMELIAIAQEVLGSDAAKVVSKLEAAPDSKEGILEVTNQCKKLVRLIIDEQKADQLMARCAGVMEQL
jgi:hypothetical protein